jgi:hypothetical protein
MGGVEMKPAKGAKFLIGSLESLMKDVDKTEAEVKKDIKKYLDSIGAYHFWPVQMGYGARTVDCLVCFKGRFFAFEVKRPKGGKLTTKQCNILNDIRKAGGAAGMVEYVDDVCLYIEAYAP